MAQFIKNHHQWGQRFRSRTLWSLSRLTVGRLVVPRGCYRNLVNIVIASTGLWPTLTNMQTLYKCIMYTWSTTHLKNKFLKFLRQYAYKACIYIYCICIISQLSAVFWNFSPTETQRNKKNNVQRPLLAERPQENLGIKVPTLLRHVP